MSKNVILDLLPAYIAGDASEETRIIVEEYAQKDQDIARLLKAGKLDSEKISSQIPAPDHLEKLALTRIRTRIHRQLIYVALVTASILMIPFIAMMFTDEVNWTASDFIAMGLILIGTGLVYVFISSKSTCKAYKFAVGIAILAGNNEVDFGRCSLFLSRYILDHKYDYYHCLQGVSQRGDWKPWILFILRAVENTSNITFHKINDIISAKDPIFKDIEAEGKY